MTKATIFATKLHEDCYSITMTVLGTTAEDVLRRFKIWQDVVRQLQGDWEIECNDLGDHKYEDPEECGPDDGLFFYPGAGSFYITCTEEELDEVDWQKFKQVEQFSGDPISFEDNNPIVVAEAALTTLIP